MKKALFATALIAALGAIAGACSSGTGSTVDAGPQCPTGSSLCGSTCVSLATDNANCGTCGTTCGNGEVCSKGTCSTSCGGGTTLCGSTCNDTKVDPNNCGACGTKCAAGEVCSGGKCATSCASSETPCGSACVDTMTDNANCGGCGALCGAGQACVGGSCTLTCQSGLTLCTKPAQGDAGADASTDAATDAPSSDAASDASSDAATEAAADAATDGSSDASADGSAALTYPYCADLQSDNLNCGGCGITCTGGEACVNGACTCPPSQTFCGGVCTNMQTDPANCGSCGKACATSQGCVGGSCVPLTQACQTGNDPETAQPWVICKVDGSGAWVSHNNANGGSYHALQICKGLGYTSLGSYGGTFANTVCGYNQPSSSCTANGSETFDGSGNCGSDTYGIILCNTVQWKCLP